MFGERVSPGPTNQWSILGLPCCWGQVLIKRRPLIHLSDYALSLSLSACFLRTRFMMSFAKDKGQLQTPRPYNLCPKVSNTNGKLLSPNHLRSLPAAPHSDLSARQYKGLFQDMMFERLRDSTFSEDASEVIVQPLPCGTLKSEIVFWYLPVSGTASSRCFIHHCLLCFHRLISQFQLSIHHLNEFLKSLSEIAQFLSA